MADAPQYPPMGSYVCVKTHGVVAWLIRRGTHSWADHTFIVVNNAGGIVEAMPGGVRRAHISEYAGCRMAVCTGGTYEQQGQVAAAALKMVGTPDDELDIVDLGLEALDVKWRWLAKLVDRQHGVICSQMAALCGRVAALDWSCGLGDLSQVTPALLVVRIPQRVSA